MGNALVNIRMDEVEHSNEIVVGGGALETSAVGRVQKRPHNRQEPVTQASFIYFAEELSSRDVPNVVFTSWRVKFRDGSLILYYPLSRV